MEEQVKLEEDRRADVIAYRSQYGSVNLVAVVGPGIVATAVSTAVAVVFCKMMDGKRKV